MKKALILLGMMFSIHFATAAQSNADSLFRIWKDASQTDTNRAIAFKNYILHGFMASDNDSTLLHLDQLITFSNQINYKKGEVMAWIIKGNVHYQKANYPASLKYYEQAMAYYVKTNDQLGKANTLFNMAVVYLDQGLYQKSLDYNERALAIFEKSGDEEGIGSALANIGVIYINQGDISKGISYYKKSLEICEKIEDVEGIGAMLMNIGNIYSEQGDNLKAQDYFERSLILFEKIGHKRGMSPALTNLGIGHKERGEYVKAQAYYERSIAISEEVGDPKGLAATLVNLAALIQLQGNLKEAKNHYENALAIREKIGDPQGVSNVLRYLGVLHLDQRNYAKALQNCQKALKIAEELGALPDQKLACICLYDTYKAMGKSNEALVYLEKSSEINKKLNKEETARQLQQIEFKQVMLQDSLAKAEEARRIREAHAEEVRKKDRTKNIYLIVGLLLLGLAGGLYSRIQYVRRSRAILQEEKDRSENLLLNILPAEIAAELKEKGRADARDFEMVSILFTDFKGFTEQSASMSAASLVNEINVCFEAFDKIMEKYGIEKIKTIGDAYMAAGGLPVPTDDSVKNTVLAALEMQKFIAQRKVVNEAQGLPAFEMRLGIHTGPVVAGIVGVKKFQYDIWGDTVNTAARMEQNSEVGKVNISQSTYELLKSDQEFEFESRGKIEAKGKGEMEMLFVTSRNHSNF